jgi:hypothetical protein
MITIQERKQHIAEHLVSSWYSLTRGLSTHNPLVFALLRTAIIRLLVLHKVHPERARVLAQEVIMGWITECEGLSLDNIFVMEVLEKRIENLI